MPGFIRSPAAGGYFWCPLIRNAQKVSEIGLSTLSPFMTRSEHPLSFREFRSDLFCLM
jgi:hypothetical protein